MIVATGSIDRVAHFPGWSLPGVMTARAVQIFLNLHRVLPGRRFAVIGHGSDADEVAADLTLAGANVAARLPSVADVRAVGDGGVERIEAGGAAHQVDTVVLALGRQPDPELVLQAQVEVAHAPAAGSFLPRRAGTLETSEAGLFVVGEAAGAETVAEAMAEGRLAGLNAAGAPADQIVAAGEWLNTVRGADRRALVARLLLPAAR